MFGSDTHQKNESATSISLQKELAVAAVLTAGLLLTKGRAAEALATTAEDIASPTARLAEEVWGLRKAAPMYLEVAGGTEKAAALSGRATAEALSTSTNRTIGAVPGLQYAHYVTEVGPENLGFLRGWTIFGAQVKDDSLSVALYGGPRSEAIISMPVKNASEIDLVAMQGLKVENIINRPSIGNTTILFDGRIPLELTGKISTHTFSSVI